MQNRYDTEVRAAEEASEEARQARQERQEALHALELAREELMHLEEEAELQRWKCFYSKCWEMLSPISFGHCFSLFNEWHCQMPSQILENVPEELPTIIAGQFLRTTKTHCTFTGPGPARTHRRIGHVAARTAALGGGLRFPNYRLRRKASQRPALPTPYRDDQNPSPLSCTSFSRRSTS